VPRSAASHDEAMSGPFRRLAVGLIVVAGLVAAGCGDDDTGAPTTPTDATGTTAEATTTDTTGSQPPGDGELAVQVFFVDEAAFNVGRPPYVVPVERLVDASDPMQAALDELFEGPTPDEQVGGLVLVASEATGAELLEVVNGTARVQLVGGCSSGGSTLTVAESILATLLQFNEVRVVKIYDLEGQTGDPDGGRDSMPECLEP
jgi:hypothetical protein